MTPTERAIARVVELLRIAPARFSFFRVRGTDVWHAFGVMPATREREALCGVPMPWGGTITPNPTDGRICAWCRDALAGATA